MCFVLPRLGRLGYPTRIIEAACASTAALSRLLLPSLFSKLLFPCTALPQTSQPVTLHVNQPLLLPRPCVSGHTHPKRLARGGQRKPRWRRRCRLQSWRWGRSALSPRAVCPSRTQFAASSHAGHSRRCPLPGAPAAAERPPGPPGDGPQGECWAPCIDRVRWQVGWRSGAWERLRRRPRRRPIVPSSA